MSMKINNINNNYNSNHILKINKYNLSIKSKNNNMIFNNK